MVQYVGDFAMQTPVVPFTKQCGSAALELMASSWSLEEQHYLVIAHLHVTICPLSADSLMRKHVGEFVLQTFVGLD